MQLRKLLQDDDAVSPVIGVILMVAITVILAAVIASFVLGLGDTNETAPSVSFDWSEDNVSGSTQGWVNASISGGDEFEASNVELSGENLGDGQGSTLDNVGNVSVSDTFSAGDKIPVWTTAIGEYQVQLIWSTAETDDEIIGEQSA